MPIRLSTPSMVVSSMAIASSARLPLRALKMNRKAAMSVAHVVASVVAEADVATIVAMVVTSRTITARRHVPTVPSVVIVTAVASRSKRYKHTAS